MEDIFTDIQIWDRRQILYLMNFTTMEKIRKHNFLEKYRFIKQIIKWKSKNFNREGNVNIFHADSIGIL